MSLRDLKKKAIVAVKKKYKDYLSDDVQLMVMDAVEYMYLHDRFAKAGVYITKGDQEENYIKILEQEDESLLDCLDRYLELVETADLLKDVNQAKAKIIRGIKEADTEAEVIDIVKKYLTEDFESLYGKEDTSLPDNDENPNFE
jgi:succinate dehydrogenase flavin-adding protein (antitoxin of CptAB toxin-antitoxin module)